MRIIAIELISVLKFLNIYEITLYSKNVNKENCL